MKGEGIALTAARVRLLNFTLPGHSSHPGKRYC